MDPLKVTLGKVARRLFIQQWLGHVVTALIVSAGLGCVWLVLTRFFPFLGDPAPVAVGLVVLGVAGATVYSVTRLPGLLAAALAADDRLGLRERFTSSLQLEGHDAPMVHALHEDARSQVKRLDLRRDFPFVAPANLRWVSVPILCFGLAYLFIPEFDLFNYRERQLQAKAHEEKVESGVTAIREEVQRIEQADEPNEGPLAEAAAFMNEIAEEFGRGEINERQVAARLLNKAEEAAAQAAALEAATPVPKLADDARQFGEAADVAKAIQEGKFAEASEKLEALRKKLEEGGLSEAEMMKLANDLANLAKCLAGQNDTLAQALAEVAESLKAYELNGALEWMEAAELALCDIDGALKQLEQLKLAQAGLCKACEGLGFSNLALPILKPGLGTSNRLGEMPEPGGEYELSVVPGQLRDGPMLATINQLAPPDGSAEATVELIRGSIVQVQQEAEQALSREEIPAGSREFVRQYFGGFDTTNTQP